MSEQGFINNNGVSIPQGFNQDPNFYTQQGFEQDSNLFTQQSINVSAQTIANSVEMQDLNDEKNKLTKQLTRDRIILIVLSVVTVIVFIARFII